MANMLRRYGFWKIGSGPCRKVPAARRKPWKGKKHFLKRLLGLEATVKGTPLMTSCPLCGKVANTVYSKGGWEWTGAVAHCVDAHNVKPAQSFIDFVLNDGVRPGMPKEPCGKRLMVVKATVPRCFDVGKSRAFVPVGVKGEVLSVNDVEGALTVAVRWFVSMVEGMASPTDDLVEGEVPTTDIEYVGLDRVSQHRPCYDENTDGKRPADEIPF